MTEDERASQARINARNAYLDESHIPWASSRRVVPPEELQELGLVDDELFLKDTYPVCNLMSDLRRIFNERD